MNTYYTLLNIAPNATSDEIAAAYERQRERYSPERIAALGDDFARVAAERTAELDRAYAVLSDPQRRAAYDRRDEGPADAPPAGRTQLSRRELLMLVGGSVVGLLVIAVVWVLAGRATQPGVGPVAAVNRPAPAFALPDLAGQTVRLEDYRGKIVMVNFWYTRCEPCREETPALEAAYKQLADDGLVILGVNVRRNEQPGPEGEADVQQFVDRYGVTYPIAYDTDNAVGRAFQVYVLPTSFFVDGQGTIRYASFSPMTSEEVERVFVELRREATATR